MTDAIDISVGDHKLVLGLLKQHLPNVAVWAYGSRVKWTARPQSDLDLVAFPSCEQKAAVFNLREALEESSLPFPVDLFIWDELPESFRKRIEAEHVVLVEKEEQSVRDGWEIVPLGELTDNFDAARVPVKRADRRPGPYPYYGASGIVDSVSDYLFDGEYLLIAEDGENLRTRNTPIASLANGKFWVNNHAHIVRGNHKANTRYLMYALSELDVSGYLTGSTMPKLTQGNMNRISLLTPPISEQRAIAHILGTLDDKIELNRRMNETLEEMARALFKSWFVDFDPVRAKMEGRDTGLPPDVADLFPDRLVESELGEIPEGWEVGCFGDIVEQIRDQENPFAFPDTLFRYFSIPAFDKDQWPQTERGENIKSQKSCVPSGAILLSKLNPEIERVWFADVAPDERAICSTEFLVLQARPPFQRSYVYCLARSPLFRQQVESLVTGTSKSHQRAQAGAVLALEATIPSAPVIRAFDRQASALLDRSVRCRRETTSLAALRDALLPKLVSGELRVVESMGREGLYHYS